MFLKPTPVGYILAGEHSPAPASSTAPACGSCDAVAVASEAGEDEQERGG
jgi:hypothetical protein